MFKDINLLLFHTNYSILHCVIPELQAGRVDPRVGSGQKIYKWVGRVQFDEWQTFISERDYVTFAICDHNSVCRLSVCDVGAPCSAGWNFRHFFTIR